jgi:hypothetical protein
MRAQVDRSERLRGSLEERVREQPGFAREREHGAVVIRIAVRVEQCGIECAGNRSDRGRVAALGDVRNREQLDVRAGAGRRLHRRAVRERRAAGHPRDHTVRRERARTPAPAARH